MCGLRSDEESPSLIGPGGYSHGETSPNWLHRAGSFFGSSETLQALQAMQQHPAMHQHQQHEQQQQPSTSLASRLASKPSTLVVPAVGGDAADPATHRRGFQYSPSVETGLNRSGGGGACMAV